jgi:hypothetical protein
LTLGWPASYTGYSLEGQTNPPGQGLTALWFAVPGVSNNSISFPLDSAAGSAFYRLVHAP